jgi:glycosyltransferase involved in cell wall biosynthesis
LAGIRECCTVGYAIKESGGEVVLLPVDVPVCDKALLLRNSAHQYADLVVLHHDGHDAVPSLAFAKAGGPPVVVLNHADHHFWLGSSIADAVINLRSKACPHTASRRFIDNNIVLPIPIDAMSDVKTRQAARQSLGIPSDQIVMLSIGRAIKYRPCGDYDFVATADRILQRVPTAHIYVVGETVDGIRPYLRWKLHDRLHFLGGVEDPSELRSAADIYLESFPFGSQTALLESALMALPAVAAYAPLFELLVTQDDAIEDLLVHPSNETEYVDRVIGLAADSDVRESLGREMRNRLLQSHVGDGWLECLHAVYQFTDKLQHHPKYLSSCGPSYSAADICLSHWHVVPNGKDHVAVTEQNAASALACHSSYVARYVGDISASRRFAWKAAILNPIAKHSWRLLGISLLGKHKETLRKVFAMS